MSKDIYLAGHAAGSESAGLSPVAVQAAENSRELGALAGLKLANAIRRYEQDGYVWQRTDSWQHGFFDGFMSRAEEIQSDS